MGFFAEINICNDSPQNNILISIKKHDQIHIDKKWP